jgi:hypothetical protein
VIIAGTIVKIPSAEVVVRGMGPSLNSVPVQDRLVDPTLEVVNSNGVTIAQNDDWQSNQANEIYATGLQPGSPKEAAIRLVLPAGANTVLLRGANNTTGTGLVEIYNLQ